MEILIMERAVFLEETAKLTWAATRVVRNPDVFNGDRVSERRRIERHPTRVESSLPLDSQYLIFRRTVRGHLTRTDWSHIGFVKGLLKLLEARE
jgi:hypothetical protein